MSKYKISSVLIITLFLGIALQLCSQTVSAATEEVDKLIAVIKSDAPHKEKADACRRLAIVGTKEAIPPLAELLADEKLSHMARYALEPIPDPAVDKALRDALDKLKGGPLVGVIGSIGVRRDTMAVGLLTEKLQDSDSQVSQAAAKALGSIGTSDAAKALKSALPQASAGNQLAMCEGLFRCAEALAEEGQRSEAVAIYDQLLSIEAPHQVRGGALRGAILARPQKDGLQLLQKNLLSEDWILFSAAVQTSQELPGEEATKVLAGQLEEMPADNQILVIQTLGMRGDPAALEALFALAGSGPKSVRLQAIRALPEIADPSAVPVFVELLDDDDGEIAKTAQGALAALPGPEADKAVMEMLASNQADRRLTSLELIGRRRMTTSIDALLEAAQDTDAKVRQAALKKVGELGDPAELPALLNLFVSLEASQDLNAAEQALRNICVQFEDRQSCTAKLINLLPQTSPAQKSTLLRVLSTLGGTDALQAVREAVNDSNEEVHSAAIRALGAWKSAEAAPDLLDLAKTAPNPKDKTLCLRAYLSMASRPDISVDERLSMCRQGGELVQQDDEKRLLLAALGGVESADALAMIVPFLNESAARDVAGTACVSVGEKIVQQKPDEVAQAMEKVIAATNNADIKNRAKEILGKAKK
jgi:HEAT repeat protein